MISAEIKPSKAFQEEAAKAVFAVVLFIAAYLILLAAAVALTLFCIAAGVVFVKTFPGIVTLFLGIGVSSLGIMVLVFLVKFVFKRHKAYRDHLIEIKSEEEPELFAVIEEVAEKVGAKFPKKVYLAIVDNAEVFYDSSFWSLFFPTRKNLAIGMALINSVTLIELKAILAHEFGHFSQKSMAVGSYVYNVNKIIFNMLFENDYYNNVMYNLSSVTMYFSPFIAAAGKIVQGIQYLLRKLYALVNVRYMSLSREMEFQADEIASHVTGYKPLKSSLIRLVYAKYAFDSANDFYTDRIEENIVGQNIYLDHMFVMHTIAGRTKTKIENNLPQFTQSEINRLDKSKLTITNQWASHPTLEERIERLESNNIVSDIDDNRLAISLIKNLKHLQEVLSEKINELLVFNGEVTTMTPEEFQKEYLREYHENMYPDMYNGYYNTKDPVQFENYQGERSDVLANPESYFSDEKIDLVYTAISLRNDIETLAHIESKTLDIKTYDYDGRRYHRKETSGLLQQLRDELSRLEKEIEENDRSIYKLVSWAAKSLNSTDQLERHFASFAEESGNFEACQQLWTSVIEDLEFVKHTVPVEIIRANLVKIEGREEKIKLHIGEMLSADQYQPYLKKVIRDTLELYISKKWQYFGTATYYEENLQMLIKALHYYGYLLDRGRFYLKRKLLRHMAETLESAIWSRHQ